jgi:hypothetical protein
MRSQFGAGVCWSIGCALTLDFCSFAGLIVSRENGRSRRLRQELKRRRIYDPCTVLVLSQQQAT